MYCVSLIPKCTHVPIWMYLKVGCILELMSGSHYWPGGGGNSAMGVIACSCMNNKSTRIKTCWIGVHWLQRNCTWWWNGLLIPRNKRFCAEAGGVVDIMWFSIPKGEVLVCASPTILRENSLIWWRKEKIFSFSKPILKNWKNKDKLIFQYTILSFLQAKNAKQESIVPQTSELLHGVDTPQRKI